MQGENFKNYSIIHFILFCLGFWGSEFLWQLRIILSAPVVENLGANPFLYGLIVLAGPVFGICIQPVTGILSDRTCSGWGKRKPYMITGAVIAAAGAVILPNAGSIAAFLNIKFISGLLLAAATIWIIDAFLNVIQGPYRALIFDTHTHQAYSRANSFTGLAIALGAICAAAMPVIFKFVFHKNISIPNQFLTAAFILILTMTISCFYIKEQQPEDYNIIRPENTGLIKNFKNFFCLNPGVVKICIMQFFTWIGVMCILIFFTHFIVHIIFGIPDLSSASADIKNVYEQQVLNASNFSSLNFFIFNFVSLICVLPIGFLASKFGSRPVHAAALTITALAAAGIFFTKSMPLITTFMGFAGIGWASICSLPYAMIMEHLPADNAASMLGIFNIFIAFPQAVSCIFASLLIKKCSFTLQTDEINYHWEYAFLIAAICIITAVFFTLKIKEKQS